MKVINKFVVATAAALYPLRNSDRFAYRRSHSRTTAWVDTGVDVTAGNAWSSLRPGAGATVGVIRSGSDQAALGLRCIFRELLNRAHLSQR